MTTKPVFLHTVRFKLDERCPCPAVIDSPESRAYWSLLRGTSVTLIKPAPEQQGLQCDSDVHWQVRLSPSLMRLIQLRQADVKALTVCRHILDIGD